MAKQPEPKRRSRKAASSTVTFGAGDDIAGDRKVGGDEADGGDAKNMSPDCHDRLLVETTEGLGIPPKPLSDHEISEFSSVQTGEQMISPEHNGKAASEPSGNVDAVHAAEENHDRTNEAVTVAATVGVVAVGAALFEIALLPGIALGVAAMLAPKYVPKMGAAFTPMFRSSVRGVYKFGQKTREMMAEAKEQVHDIVAEVHAEGDAPKAAAKSTAEAPHA
jgi:hypothetical protein